MEGVQVRRCPHNPRRVSVISPLRGRRPRRPAPRAAEGGTGPCPFCPGSEHVTPPATLVLTLDGAGRPAFSRESGGERVGSWLVRAFPNKYPALAPTARGEAYGFHEVLVESRTHSEAEYLRSGELVFYALLALLRRLGELSSEPGVRHVSVVKNRGAAAGASIEHPHLQLLATSFVPPEVEAEAEAFGGGRCPLCEAASSGGPPRLLVYANEGFLVVAAHAPRSPYELHVIPREHRENPLGLAGGGLLQLADALRYALLALREALGDVGYNYWYHMSFAGDGSFHWHVEILPATSAWGGCERGLGVYVVDTYPEEAAARLRRALRSAVERGA